MTRPEPTLLTKWGRLTSQQYQRRRAQVELEEWLTDEALHYLFTRTPYRDADNQIVDHHFRYLLQQDPDAAQAQLQREERDYYAWLAEHDRHRHRETVDQAAACAAYVRSSIQAGRARPSRGRPSSGSLARSKSLPTQLSVL